MRQLEAGHGEKGSFGFRGWEPDPIRVGCSTESSDAGRGRREPNERNATGDAAGDDPARGAAAGDDSGNSTGSLSALGNNTVARMATTDVGRPPTARPHSTRLQRLSMVLAPIAVLLILRDLFDPAASIPDPPLPAIPPTHAAGHGPDHRPVAGHGGAAAGCRPLAPHPLPARRADMTFDDVRGSEGLVEEVTKTLNLFLAHRTFAEQMGGSPRKAILFEGPPGYRQDLHGQGHGRRGRGAVPLRVVFGLPVDVLRPDQPEDPVLLQGPAPLRPARGRRHRVHRRARRHRWGPRASADEPRRGHPRGGQRAVDPAPVVRADAGLAAHEGPVRRCRQHLASGPPAPAQARSTFRPISWSSGPPTGLPTSTRRCCVRADSTATSTSGCRAGRAGGTSSTTTWARRPTRPNSTNPLGGRPWPR